MVLTAMLVAATLFVGLASRVTSDEDREWWSRAGAWILIAILGWSVPTTIVVWGPEWIAELKKWVASLGGVAAVVTVLLGGSSRTSATAQTEKSPSLLALAADRAPVVAAPVLAMCIVIFLSMGTDWALVGLDWARAAFHDDPARARVRSHAACRHHRQVRRGDRGGAGRRIAPRERRDEPHREREQVFAPLDVSQPADTRLHRRVTRAPLPQSVHRLRSRG
jgi:hypothetical protein